MNGGRGPKPAGGGETRPSPPVLSAGRGDRPTAAAAALRAEAGGYRAEAGRLSSKGVDGGLGAWRAAERRDRAADLLDPGGGS